VGDPHFVENVWVFFRPSGGARDTVCMPAINGRDRLDLTMEAMASLFDLNDDDARGQILRFEEQIEDLVEIIERCRKITLISKAVIGVGATLIFATVLGAIRVDPMVMIGAITAVVGGTVVFGSNTSTLEQAEAAVLNCFFKPLPLRR
jgi:hypothetical protein